jgi:hypothetical protein
MLVIFSDMRENAGNLKPENLRPRDVHCTLAKFAQGRLLPDLKGVEVYVLGADNAGKSVAYWTALRDFWAEFPKRRSDPESLYSAAETAATHNHT